MNKVLDRDIKGRFVRGHKVLRVPHRDSVTGCFISDNEFKHRTAVSEMNCFFDNGCGG